MGIKVARHYGAIILTFDEGEGPLILLNAAIRVVSQAHKNDTGEVDEMISELRMPFILEEIKMTSRSHFSHVKARPYANIFTGGRHRGVDYDENLGGGLLV